MTFHARLRQLSMDEYLQGELTSNQRHEYVTGQVYAMVGASRTHNLITLNLAAAFHAHLRNSPCRVFALNMKVRIEAVDVFYYPDLAVSCAAADDRSYFLTEPVLIVEVLSRVTEATERREKFMHYRKLESLREYVLVSQEAPRVEIYRREKGNDWWMDSYGDKETARFDSLRLKLQLTEIYAKTSLPGA